MRWSIGISVAFICFFGSAYGQPAAPIEYRIDDAQSFARVLVSRGGLLGGLGHNHVISVVGMTGSIWLHEDIEQSTMTLDIPVGALSVDDASSRMAEGSRFRVAVPQKDVDATRENMLGDKLLQFDIYPTIRIRSLEVTGETPDVTVVVEATIRDHQARLAFPAKLEITEDRLTAAGSLRVTHKELGLRPFTAALGTLRVKDELTINYRITAMPVSAGVAAN